MRKIGITASQAINAMYAQIVMRQGMPFELKILPTARDESDEG